jgi:hypothetical protein
VAKMASKQNHGNKKKRKKVAKSLFEGKCWKGKRRPKYKHAREFQKTI